MPVLEVLNYWRDERKRTAAENMAVDQLLIEQMGQHPVLRVYQWGEPAVSFGYFHCLEDAKAAFPSTAEQPIVYVRRWTGGGIVDHRDDLTYTLVIPKGCALSRERGPESYRLIHQALGNTLEKLGRKVKLVAHKRSDGGKVCFSNPVAYDLVDPEGEKIAGAGQRRTRNGLLHQGSIVTGLDAGLLGQVLADCLADTVETWWPTETIEIQASKLAIRRYASEQWLATK